MDGAASLVLHFDSNSIALLRFFKETLQLIKDNKREAYSLADQIVDKLAGEIKSPPRLKTTNVYHWIANRIDCVKFDLYLNAAKSKVRGKAHELIDELNLFIVKSSGGKKNNKLLGYLNFLINELEKGYNRHSGIFKLNAITEMVDRKDEIVRELMKMNGLKESVRRFVDYVKKLWGEVKSWFKSDGGLRAILDQGKTFLLATKTDLNDASLGIFSKLARVLSNAESFFNKIKADIDIDKIRASVKSFTPKAVRAVN